MSLVDALLLDPAPLNVWIAWRTDGVKGSGTHSDPYDASTKLGPFVNTALNGVERIDNDMREVRVTTASAHGFQNGNLVFVTGDTNSDAALWTGVFAIYSVTSTTFRYQMRWRALVDGTYSTMKVARVIGLPFDDLMNGLPAGTCVHLGPTPAHRPFLTRGYADEVSGGWQPKAGLKIVGSGMDTTVLQLAGAATVDKQYYAVGHALKTTSPAAPNPMDGFEISDLTIDCALHAQPAGSGKNYAPVACGAVRVMGSHCRVRRVKAINWGTKSATECRVFDLVAATADPFLLETANAGIEDCIAIEPNNNSFGPTTAFSIRGIELNGVQGYGKSPFIRNCFIDGSLTAYVQDSEPAAYEKYSGIVTSSAASINGTGVFRGKRNHHLFRGEYARFLNPNYPTSSAWNGYFPIENREDSLEVLVTLAGSSNPDSAICGAEIRGLSIASCRGGVVEGNHVFEVWFGLHVDTYATMLNAKDVIVRNNFFKNVASAAFWKAGAVPTSNLSVTSVGTLSPTGFAELTTASAHNLFVNAWVGLVNGGATAFYRVSNVIDATHFEIAASSQPVGNAIRLVRGVDKLLIEGNIIELADFDSTEYAAPRLDASGTQPIAVLLSDTGAPGSGTAYSIGDVVIRNNKIRYIDGKILGAPSGQPLAGTGIQVGGARNLLIQSNVIETVPSNPLQNFRCGSVSYFHNKSPGGTLTQGLNGTTNQKYDELETEAEDAFVLSLFTKKR